MSVTLYLWARPPEALRLNTEEGWDIIRPHNLYPYSILMRKEVTNVPQSTQQYAPKIAKLRELRNLIPVVFTWDKHNYEIALPMTLDDEAKIEITFINKDGSCAVRTFIIDHWTSFT